MAVALMALPPAAEASRGKAKVKSSAARSKQKQKAKMKATSPGKSSRNGKSSAQPGQSTIGSGFFRNPAGGSAAATGARSTKADKGASSKAQGKTKGAAAAKQTKSSGKASQKNLRTTSSKAPRSQQSTRTASRTSRKVTPRQARTSRQRQARTQQKAQRPARQARVTQSQRQQARPQRVQARQAPRPSLGRRIASAAGKVAKGAGLVVLVAAPSILFPMAGLPIVAGLTASGFLGVGAVAGIMERAIKSRGNGQPGLSPKEQMLEGRGLTPEQRYIYANRAIIQQHQLGNGPGGL